MIRCPTPLPLFMLGSSIWAYATMVNNLLNINLPFVVFDFVTDLQVCISRLLVFILPKTLFPSLNISPTALPVDNCKYGKRDKTPARGF